MDYVFVPEVLDELRRVGDATLFRVKVVEQIQGRVPETVLVGQIGSSVATHRWELEEQPRMQVGGTYIIAASAPSDRDTLYDAEALGVVSGPWGAPEYTEQTLAAMTAGVEQRVFPVDLSEAFMATKATIRSAWEAERPEFRSDPVMPPQTSNPGP